MKSDENNGTDPDDVGADDSVDEPTMSPTKSDADSEVVDTSAADEVTLAKTDPVGGGEDSDDDVSDSESDTPTESKAKSAGGGSTSDGSSRHWLASLALAGASAALVVAVVCLAYFGYTGIRAYAVDSARDQARIGAVDGAEQAVLNTFTVDPAHMDAWQKRLSSSLTGNALKQAVDQSAQELIQQVEDAKNKANSIKVRIITSAATEVNADEGTAKVFVLSEATASSAPQQPTGLSYLMTMVKEDGVWKASDIVPLSEIAYSDSDSTPVPGPSQEGGN